jgi:hypothetical protein
MVEQASDDRAGRMRNARGRGSIGRGVGDLPRNPQDRGDPDTRRAAGTIKPATMEPATMEPGTIR